MEDPGPKSGVNIDGYGWMSLDGRRNEENSRVTASRRDETGDFGYGKA